MGECEYTSPWEEGFYKTETKIWWMNLNCEIDWAEKEIYLLGKNQYENKIIQYQDQLCLLLAAPDDIVILRNSPSKLFLMNLMKYGISLPEIWILPQSDLNQSISQCILNNSDILLNMKKRNRQKQCVLMPYGITSLEEKISELTGIYLYGSGMESSKKVNSKVFARNLASSLSLPVSPGSICCDCQELSTFLAKQNDDLSFPLVIKQSYGSSGKGLFVVKNKKELQTIFRILRCHPNSFPVIVEKWHNHTISINYQILITRDGDKYYIPVKNQIMRDTVFRGCDGMIQNNRLSDNQKSCLKDIQRRIADTLYLQGHFGVFSIDALVLDDGDLIPILEINGRFSLTTYITTLLHHQPPNKCVIFEYINFRPISEECFLHRLESVAYDKKKDEGVMLCSFNPGHENSYHGRAFLLYLANSDSGLSYLMQKVRIIYTDIILL